MKKAILSFALLFVALTGSAQTLKVNFKKGDVSKYSSVTNLSFGIPMQGEEKGQVNTNSAYTVLDAGSDGWTVEMKVDTFWVSGNEDILNQYGNAEYMKALMKTPARLKLDAKGSIIDLENADDLLAVVAQAALDGINDTYSKHPELEQVLPKSKAMLKLNDELTKENALKFFRENSVLSLNGKDIKQDQPVEEDLMDFIKAKSIYKVTVENNGQTTIGRTSVSNMKEDDIKAFLKGQLSKMGGDVDDSQLNAAWSQMKAMGMTNVDLSSTDSSSFASDGWLEKESGETTATIIGAKIVIGTTTTKL